MQSPGLYLLFDLSFVNLDGRLECWCIDNFCLQSSIFASVCVVPFGRLCAMSIAHSTLSTLHSVALAVLFLLANLLILLLLGRPDNFYFCRLLRVSTSIALPCSCCLCLFPFFFFLWFILTSQHLILCHSSYTHLFPSLLDRPLVLFNSVPPAFTSRHCDLLCQFDFTEYEYSSPYFVCPRLISVGVGFLWYI